MSRAVSISTGVWSPALRSRRQTSRPSSFGIIMSRITASAGWAASDVEGLLAVLGQCHVMVLEPQCALEGATDRRLIVDYQNARHCGKDPRVNA